MRCEPFPITFFWMVGGKPEFPHATVIDCTKHVVQFIFKHSPETTPTLKANVDDEGATWVRGWLRWWWPSDRATRRSMLAAAAMGATSVEITKTAQEKLNTSFDESMKALMGDAQRLVEDAVRIAGDAQRLPKLPRLPPLPRLLAHRHLRRFPR